MIGGARGAHFEKLPEKYDLGLDPGASLASQPRLIARTYRR
jgi:hypothetical protein